MINILRPLIAFFIVFCLNSILYAHDLSHEERLKIYEAYGRIPLHFIKNNGEVDGKIKYYHKGSHQSVYFTQDGVHLVLTYREKGGKSTGRPKNKTLVSRQDDQGTEILIEVVKLIPIHSNKNVQIDGEGKLPCKIITTFQATTRINGEQRYPYTQRSGTITYILA